MAQAGNFSITPHTDGRCYGGDALAQFPLNPGSQSPNAMRMGTNIANPTCLNGSWPLADLVKMSGGWNINGGSGNFTIDNQDRITSMDGTIEFSKVLSYGNLSGLPRAGTYTVTKPPGSGDVQILAGSVSTGFQSSDTFTFTCNAGDSITMYTRSSDGNVSSLTAVSVVYEDDLATFQAGNPWSQLWYNFIAGMNPRILRPQLTHDIREENFSERTLPEALSYVSVSDKSTGLENENGSRHLAVPLELQIDLANRLQPEVLWWQIPAHATDDYITQAAPIYRDNLDSSISIALERGNEAAWNSAGPFYYNLQVVRTWYRNKIRCTGGNGGNSWSTRDGSNHTFNNGDVVYTIVSPGSNLQERGSAYGHNVDQVSRPSVPLTPMQIANVTATGFDLVSLQDGTTPYNAETGLTEIDVWLETAADQYINDDFQNHVGEEYGKRAVEFFNIATSIITGHTTYQGLGTQSDVTALTDAMTGPNGANGNFDVLYLGLYYNAMDVFSVTDTDEDIYNANVTAYQNVVQDALVAHVNAGYPADTLWFYESGDHNELSVMPGADTLSQAERDQVTSVLLRFKRSQYAADMLRDFYQECQAVGVRYAAITSMDTYSFGTFGSWGSKSELTDPDLPITDLYQSWGGFIGPQSGDNISPTITLAGDPVVYVDTGGSYTDQGAQWNDNVDGTGQVFADMTGVNFSTPGTYTISYSYTDQAGNGPTTVTRDIVVADPVVVTSNEFYVAGHSLFTYTGGSPAPATSYTNAGNWLGHIAAHNGAESVGGYTFGQVSDINTNNWGDLSSVPVTGAYSQGNTRSFDPEDNGLVGNNLDRYFFMPSNYLEVDVGGPPFNGDEDTFQAVAEQFIANMDQHWPNAEKILYIHCPDGGHYSSTGDMTAAQFTNFVNDTLGDYLDWFITVQNLINANNSYDIKSFPVYPVMLWIIENESYLSSTTFSDYFGDGAPHGTETAYFLMALVLYRCIYQSNPDMTGFTFPSGTNVISEVQNNLPAIISAIETRLAFHNSNGVNVY